MRYKLAYVLLAVITFVMGVAASADWLSSSCLTSKLPSDAAIYPQSANIRAANQRRACSKSFRVNLGDSFQYVKELLDLQPNPNGPHENVFWQVGKLTDFYSVSQPSLEIDTENRLHPAVFATFDDQQKLHSLHVSWTYDGWENPPMKRKIIRTLIEQEFVCLQNKPINFERKAFADKLDGGDYVQEFEANFGTRTSWWGVRYSIAMKE